MKCGDPYFIVVFNRNEDKIHFGNQFHCHMQHKLLTLLLMLYNKNNNNNNKKINSSKINEMLIIMK